jgi:hypothetical protein
MLWKRDIFENSEEILHTHNGVFMFLRIFWIGKPSASLDYNHEY